MREKFLESYQHTPRVLLDQPLPHTVALQQTGDTFELLIYDVIGCGCCEAEDVVNKLALAAGAAVKVRINSPGGDAFAGVAIMNALTQYAGPLTTQVDGVAASAASYIAMAGQSVMMMPASFMMIHNAWTVSIGDKAKLQLQIAALTHIDQMQCEVFCSKTDMAPQDMISLLDAETWMSAEEALQAGFSDGMVPKPMKPTMNSSFALERRRKLLASRLLSKENSLMHK